MQFAISPLACVSEKIIIQLAILGLSLVGYGKLANLLKILYLSWDRLSCGDLVTI